MPYIVNGKTYTSNPLMDEIVYNCKLILDSIVVKNEYVAHLYETQETIDNQEIYFKCVTRTMTIDKMPITFEMWEAYKKYHGPFDSYIGDITLWPQDMEYIVLYIDPPIEDILLHANIDLDELLEFCIQYYLDHYEEKNKYYRSLMGLPEYGTTKYDIYITESDLPDGFEYEVDYSLPIHEQPSIVISALRSNGRLDELIEQYRSFNYSYLRFLDDKAIDLYKARKALKWEILYLPSVNSLVSSRFREVYEINRQIYLRRTYQNAYAYDSNYYDHMLIFILLSQTFSDMITDTAEWFIRKDIFDIRTVQFFLEAYGIPFFEEIPLKYQVRIVQNLNKLIKYKSTQQNFEDIIDIFKLRETNVYRYYLYKKRKMDEHGQYVEDPDLNKMYELSFIEVILGDTYDNYVKNLNYRNSYDEVTLPDEYWDGIEDHEKVKLDILKKDFTIEPTKYLTIKSDIRYIDFQKQLVYLLGLIIDNRINIDDIKIGVRSIYEGAQFKLADLFLYMELLNNLESDLSQFIRRPEDMKEYTETYPDYDLDRSDWWMKERYPEFFTRKSDYRVFGFNPEINLEEIEEVVSRPYSNSTQRTFNLAYFGCDSYIVPNEPITTFDQLIDIYDTNMKCYNNLIEFINYKAMDKFEVLMAKYIFDELFTKRFNYELTDGKRFLDEVLLDRNYILYSSYKKLESATDKESRNKDISAILNDVVTTLEYYMDRDTIDYFFSFLSTTNFTAITRYIYLMLNTFKSYKAHFIEPTIRYQFLINDGMTGNGMLISDSITNRTTYYSKFDLLEMHDFCIRTVIRYVEDGRRPQLEILDIFSGFEPDPNDDYIYDGGTPENVEEDYTKTIDGTNPAMKFPYKMADGGHPYGYNGVRKYDIDGKDQSLPDIDNQYAIEIDGGDISEFDEDFVSDSNYFIKQFKKDYDGGSPATDYIINNNFFKRVYDNQESVEMSIAARTGLEYTEDVTTGEATLKEQWREWLSITEFEALKGDADKLKEFNNVEEFESFYQQFLDDLGHNRIKVFINELQEKKNRGIDITLSNSPDMKGISNIVWIEDIGNKDTSRVITYQI